MKYLSLRYRLSISYAVIALLTVLLLGGIMILILFNFYLDQEKEYLSQNAQEISYMFSSLVESQMPEELKQLLLENISFLSNAQVRILDTDRAVLFDTGLPEDITSLTFDPMGQGFGFIEGEEVSVIAPLNYSEEINPYQIYLEVTDFSTFPGRVISYAEDDPFTELQEVPRSSVVMTQPLYDNENHLYGYVEVSNGPAYGRNILWSVIRGWGFAGLISILVAVLSGILVSRRISTPIVSLAAVTSEMSAGNLSARAEVGGGDEFAALAASFNAMADTIQNKVETLQRFVADAAHEIYTPLTALRTNLELASTEEDLKDKESYLQSALDQSARINQLTKGLLELSRLESMEKPDDLEEINLGEIVQKVGEHFASQAEQAEIIFRMNVYKDSALIWAEKPQIEILISNLLDNAIKFTPKGGEVTVELRENDNDLILTIKDTGIGIPKEDLPHMFSRFHRGRNVSDLPGNGLGLAIADAIARKNNASIVFESDANGTMASVFFNKK